MSEAAGHGRLTGHPAPLPAITIGDYLEAARRGIAQLGRLVALDQLPCVGGTVLTWAELLVAGSAIDPTRLAAREATLHPDDPASIEYEPLPDGELRATTLTHGDYLGHV